MSKISASAPGKIVLCGEYAVLDGAPAIVTAVTSRAKVEVETIAGDESIVLAPGMMHEQVRFHREASGKFRWSAGRYRLVEKVLGEFAGTGTAALSLNLDTRDFRDSASGKKFGFGSSAALATALTSALDAGFGSQLDVHSLAASAHRSYQSGKGSGVDIAASFAGGTLRFERRDKPLLRALGWPNGLGYRILWSGQPASTAQKLRRLDGRKPSGEKTAVALFNAASRAAELWETQSADAVLAALRDYVACLQRFSASHEIGIFDAGHQELLLPAASLGLVYKPCGAGGGDIGVVFGTDEDALTEFCEHAARTGFTLLHATVAAHGVEITQRNDS